MIWRGAGDTSDSNNATLIPLWAAYTVAIALEFLCAVFTFGTKSPPLRRDNIDYFVNENTYIMEKAKRILGYRPVVKTREVLG
jgi:hypothetical protein